MLKVTLKIVINNHSLQAHKSARYLLLHLRQRNIYSAIVCQNNIQQLVNTQSNTNAVMLPRALPCHWRTAISRHAFASIIKIILHSHLSKESGLLMESRFSVYSSKVQMQKQKSIWKINKSYLSSSLSGGLAVFVMQLLHPNCYSSCWDLSEEWMSLMTPYTSLTWQDSMSCLVVLNLRSSY